MHQLALFALVACVTRTEAALAVTDSADQPLVEVAFGPTAIGQSESAVVRIANHGSAPSAPLELQIVGPASGEYGLVPACGGHVLEPDGQCEITLVFSPTRHGDSSAELLIAGDPQRVQAIAIAGHAP